MKSLTTYNFLGNFGIVYVLFPELTSIFYPIRRWLCDCQDNNHSSPFGQALRVITPMVKARRDDVAKDMYRDEKHFLSRLVADQSFSDMDVIGNSIFAMAAAQETSAMTMSYAVNVLVNDLELQEDLRDEIRGLVARDGKLNNNAFNDLPKLTAFINEVLRLYPPAATGVTRRAKFDYPYQDASGQRITIPKNCGVFIGAYALHRDARNWERPEEFDVHRFDSGVKNINEAQAFGKGPRHCVGMVFGMIAIKLALGELLMRFKVVPSPKTEKVLVTKEFFATLIPVNGVYAKLVAI